MISTSLALVHILVGGEGIAGVGFEDAETIERACRAALGPSECVIVSAPPEGPHAEVRLGTREVHVVWRSSSGDVLERTLQFAREEAREERAVAAGLLVAALSATDDAMRAPAPSAPAPPPSPVREAPLRVTTPEESTDRSRFEVGGAFQVGLDFEVPTLGGEARFWVPVGTSSFGLVGGVGYHEPLTSVFGARSVSGSAGGFFRMGEEAFAHPSVFVFAEALAQAAAVDVTRAGETETLGYERWGARLGTHFGFALGAVTPYLGLEGRWLAPRVVVRVAGEELTAAQEFSGALSLGLRFRVL